jgi:isopentenyl-diphosphate Delta-isomerase
VNSLSKIIINKYKIMDEIIEIYDEFNNFLKLKKEKSEAHKYGYYHRSVHIWIFNSNGEILLQKRSKDKLIYPGKFDISVAGHVGLGENSYISAIREIKEEINLIVKGDDLKFYKIFHEKLEETNKFINNEFCYVYFLEYNDDIKNLKIQEEELQCIKFFNISELEYELKNNPNMFVPHGNYWFEIIEQMKLK